VVATRTKAAAAIDSLWTSSSSSTRRPVRDQRRQRRPGPLDRRFRIGRTGAHDLRAVPGVFAKGAGRSDSPPPDMIGCGARAAARWRSPTSARRASRSPTCRLGARGGDLTGTSMAAPVVSGAAALLQSGWCSIGSKAGARHRAQAGHDHERAAGSRRLGGRPGDGRANVSAAFRWSRPGTRPASTWCARCRTAERVRRAGAYRRGGLSGPADTVQRFDVRSVGGQPAARLMLSSDQPWLAVQRFVDLSGGPRRSRCGTTRS